MTGWEACDEIEHLAGEVKRLEEALRIAQVALVFYSSPNSWVAPLPPGYEPLPIQCPAVADGGKIAIKALEETA